MYICIYIIRIYIDMYIHSLLVFPIGIPAFLLGWGVLLTLSIPPRMTTGTCHASSPYPYPYHHDLGPRETCS